MFTDGGAFVTLLFFESHSMTYGDHCVCCRADSGPLQQCEAANLRDRKDRLRALELTGGPSTIVVAHHFGRAVSRQSRTLRLEGLDAGSGDPVDCCYVRLRQHDDQYAWSSPIRVTSAWARPPGAAPAGSGQPEHETPWRS